jgi:hypothetical protein
VNKEVCQDTAAAKYGTHQLPHAMFQKVANSSWKVVEVKIPFHAFRPQQKNHASRIPNDITDD